MAYMANTSMSNEVAIRIENLGKRYRYGGPAAASSNLRADLTDWAKGLWPRRSQRSAISAPPATAPHHATLHEVQEKHIAEDPNYFWALRDINLEIKQGEVVGIIGRNGAGKSTLLKILSRITPPTTGKITYNGRMASLLEVGTGFHRELTGRENIFLNGSILGMKRSEIAKKFEEIVAFAEVEKFIDTPVKFYSSGMYVRLAFAVAAHLEPEILVVDEVLAVGDAAFQKKCLGKMGDVAKQGRTVLLVSHQLSTIRHLCHRVALLSCGELVQCGEPSHVIDYYLTQTLQDRLTVAYVGEPDSTLDFQVLRARVFTLISDRGATKFDVFDRIAFEIEYVIRKTVIGYGICLELIRNGAPLLMTLDISETPELLGERGAGKYKSSFSLPVPLLKPGLYSATIKVGRTRTNPIQVLESVLTFEVELLSRSAQFASYSQDRPGVVAVAPKWTTEQS